MLASHLLIANRTRSTLHVIVRPHRGTLYIMLFPAPLPRSLEIPSGVAAGIPTTEALTECMEGTKLKFQLRNRAGTELSLGIGMDKASGNPAIVIDDAHPPQDDDEEDGV